jgi:hypothetical protein
MGQRAMPITESVVPVVQAGRRAVRGRRRQTVLRYNARNEVGWLAACDELGPACRDLWAWLKAHPCPDATLGRHFTGMLDDYGQIASQYVGNDEVDTDRKAGRPALRGSDPLGRHTLVGELRRVRLLEDVRRVGDSGAVPPGAENGRPGRLPSGCLRRPG